MFSLVRFLRIVRSLAVVLPVLFALVLPGRGAASQLDLKAPIALSLESADLLETLGSFAHILGVSLDVAPGVQAGGTVTLDFDNVPVAMALSEICADQGLLCDLPGRDRLRVRQRPVDLGIASVADPAPIDVSLLRADLVQTLTSFARIASLDVSVDPAVHGSVTVSLESAPWPAALDLICAASGCDLLWGDGTLAVVPASPAAIAGSRLDLSVVDADLGAVLGSFAKLSALEGVALDVDPAASRTPVTASLEDVSWTELLQGVCKAAGCDWSVVWADDGQASLRVRMIAERLARAVSLAPFRGTLAEAAGALAEAGGFESVRFAPGVDQETVVDLAADGRPWRDVADALVRHVDGRWTVLGRVIEIGPRVPVLSEGPRQAAKPPEVVLSTRLGAAEARQRRIVFSWAQPVHRARLGDQGLVLSWIPFAPDRQVVVPILASCADGLATVEALGTVDLPLDLAWNRDRGTFGVGLSAAADDGTAVPVARSTKPKPCMGAPEASLRVVAEVAGREAMLRLGTQAGRYLVLTPAPAGPDDEPESAAALVMLGHVGTAADRRVAVALVRPSADAATVERIEVPENGGETVAIDTARGALTVRLTWAGASDG